MIKIVKRIKELLRDIKEDMKLKDMDGEDVKFIRTNFMYVDLLMDNGDRNYEK